MNEILTELARLSVTDLRRISRTVDLIVSADALFYRPQLIRPSSRRQS